MYTFKTILLVIAILLIAGTSFSQNLLKLPEGVVFDYENNRYLVSNWESGEIVQIDSAGNQSYFATGLGNCSGVKIVDSTLYVSCNNRILRGINLNTGAVVLNMTLSTSGLHGLTADSSGYLYAADWSKNKIYKVDLETETFTEFVVSGLSMPLGLEYDLENNRLIVVSIGDNHDIQSVDLSNGNVSTIITTNFANLDDITVDQDGNYYIGTYDDTSNNIYKYDHNFTSAPELLVTTNNSILIDLCYNQKTNIIAHVDYGTNSISFHQMKIVIDVDTSIGWVPYDIQFSGSCDYDVNSWYWDFGDGGTSTEQNPIHTFTNHGYFNVSLVAITSDNDTLLRVYPNRLIGLADSLVGDTVTGVGSESVAFTISLANKIELRQIDIPIEYQGSLPLTYDSISITGCRTEHFSSANLSHIDTWNKRLTIRLISSINDLTVFLPAGNGPVVKVYFTLHPAANPNLSADMILDGYTSGSNIYLPVVENYYVTYNPIFISGAINVKCCFGMRGNVDNDPSDIVDISDLVFLVDFMFTEGPDPQCNEEANIDGDLGKVVDISDLVYLVDYLFTSGPDPTGCL